MPESPYVIEVTAKNFQAVILEGSMQQPVLVDFWADWCQPCKTLMPMLAKLADEYQGAFLLAKINTEEQQELAGQFQIRSIPACKLFVNGQMADEFTGALPEEQIRAFLDKHIPRESDNLVEQAQQLLQQGDADAAADLIAQALKENPANSSAIIAFAQLKASIGESDAAQQALDSLPEDEQKKPEVAAMRAQIVFDEVTINAPPLEELEKIVAADAGNSEARYQLAAQLVMHNQLEAALDQLMVLLQKDRGYGDDAARKAMIRVFDILGEHPIATKYRSRMFGLLH
ncbi:MAG: thioredoxin [Gammaproteobacteria bacterium]|nr:thioredoxin [Gammaproteobacteria bacterium]